MSVITSSYGLEFPRDVHTVVELVDANFTMVNDEDVNHCEVFMTSIIRHQISTLCLK